MGVRAVTGFSFTQQGQALGLQARGAGRQAIVQGVAGAPLVQQLHCSGQAGQATANDGDLELGGTLRQKDHGSQQELI